jgi:UDP-GlcNAc3NAcA epimerase
LKILTVIGTRPQFIKASPVSHALLGAGIEEVIVNTGQHYDVNMSELFFKELEIPEAKHNLEKQFRHVNIVVLTSIDDHFLNSGT